MEVQRVNLARLTAVRVNGTYEREVYAQKCVGFVCSLTGFKSQSSINITPHNVLHVIW